MSILFILNDPPYGTERRYNALRLAGALLKQDAKAPITVFLMPQRCARSERSPEFCGRVAGWCSASSAAGASGPRGGACAAGSGHPSGVRPASVPPASCGGLLARDVPWAPPSPCWWPRSCSPRANSLRVQGEAAITVFHAVIDSDESPAERRFCSRCGSALWVWDPHWPELVHPFASAIDTPLPEPPERVHIMLDSKPAWVRIDGGEDDRRHQTYPAASLEDWHRRHGLLDGD